MKKLMILGGSRYIIPVIETAHHNDIYVITCDYLPNNIAHKYSDEYCNVSVIDKEKVLDIAREKKIDGIISFACDPGVVTASYVAEKLNLPFQGSYESVSILQNKGLFREFLLKNGFNSPYAKSYKNFDDAFKEVGLFKWPVIVKPTDSAGSKGVTKVCSLDELEEAVKLALNESHNETFIVEEFITFKGAHSSTDVFTTDGLISFISFSDQLFDSQANNPYTPTKIIWPSSMDDEHQRYLASEMQRLMKLLGMKTGIYNIESCVGSDGKPYIMEVSPRGGGCKIAELQKMAFGIDFIEAEVRNAVGLPIHDVVQKECNGYWCEYVIHTIHNESGCFDKIEIEKTIKENNIKLIDLSVNSGDIVHPFSGANMSIGDMFLKFDSREELDEIMDRVDDWLSIKLY